MAKIKVNNSEITVLTFEKKDYISLTDMANAKEGEGRAADIIKNWLRTRYALEFLSFWEQINNPNFKVVESDHFKMKAGLANFVLRYRSCLCHFGEHSKRLNQPLKWLAIISVTPTALLALL